MRLPKKALKSQKINSLTVLKFVKFQGNKYQPARNFNLVFRAAIFSDLMIEIALSAIIQPW